MVSAAPRGGGPVRRRGETDPGAPGRGTAGQLLPQSPGKELLKLLGPLAGARRVLSQDKGGEARVQSLPGEEGFRLLPEEPGALFPAEGFQLGPEGGHAPGILLRSCRGSGNFPRRGDRFRLRRRKGHLRRRRRGRGRAFGAGFFLFPGEEGVQQLFHGHTSSSSPRCSARIRASSSSGSETKGSSSSLVRRETVSPRVLRSSHRRVRSWGRFL